MSAEATALVLFVDNDLPLYRHLVDHFEDWYAADYQSLKHSGDPGGGST